MTPGAATGPGGAGFGEGPVGGVNAFGGGGVARGVSAAAGVAGSVAKRGVLALPTPDAGETRRGRLLPALGMGLGLAAASLTAAAGVAAERLSRDRRVAVALDEDLGADPFAVEASTTLVVTTSDGVDLHVEIDEPDAPAPDAPTVVLSHGYCLESRSWVFQRRLLREAGYRVVLWDQRGHGRSGVGPAAGYDIDRLGDDLDLVLAEAAPTGPLVLVGHSMGGMTMMALALHHPEVLERVVGAAFVATSPGGLSEVTYGLGTSLGGLVHRLGPGTTGLLAPRQRLVDQAVRLGRDVVDHVVDWGSFASPVPLSVAHLTAEMIFSTRMEVISAFFGRFDTHDKREALARYDGIETLVLSGVQDRLTPPSHSEEIVRLVPGAEQILVADAGHVIMLEHPDLVGEALLDLVRRAQRSAGALTEPGRSRTVTPRIPRRVTDVAARDRAARARAQTRKTPRTPPAAPTASTTPTAPTERRRGR